MIAILRGHNGVMSPAPSSSPTGRVGWDDLPPSVRGAIARREGGEVLSATVAPSGFSPGFAGVLSLAGGGRVFVKAGDGATNAETARLHAREAEIAGALPRGLAPAPRWRLTVEGWVVLAFDAVDGRHPGSPWSDADLNRVLRAHAEMAARPAPAVLRPIAPRMREMFVGWTHLRGGERRDVPAWAGARLAEFADWEGGQTEVDTAGDAIVHLDLRSDNLLLEGDVVHVLDWPHAGVGAAWVDVVLFAPTVELEGGPPAAEVFARSAVADSAPLDAVRRVVSGWAGRLLWSSDLPDPPGIPHLRPFQRAQAGVALAWLQQLL
jgi:hypothetical protein